MIRVAYKIDIDEYFATDLASSLKARDEFARAAQDKVNMLNSEIERLIGWLLKIAGKDPKEARGAVRLASEAGKHFLIVDAPQARSSEHIAANLVNRSGDGKNI